MRVLLISHTCQSRTEGQPKAAELARKAGIELLVLAPDRWLHYGRWRAAEPPPDPAYTFVAGRVLWPWLGPAQFYLHWYPGLAGLLRTFRPDIIDLWEEPWGLVSAHACLLRRRLLPSARILSETEQNLNKTLPPPFERLRAYTLRSADFVVGRNTESLAVVRSKGYTGPCEVVPNAVDAELFHPMDRAACRQALGIDGFTVGYVGRLVEEKGLEDLVAALALCPPGVRLLFVGAGPLQEPLQQRITLAGLSSRVRFLPAQPLEALPQIMNALDVLCLPSRTTPRWKEQFGRVLIEAHACRTPVIGTASGAIPDVIGAAGLVVPERDPHALAAAIQTLHQNPLQGQEMGRIGRAQVETAYTWERVADRMAVVYHRMLQG